MRVVIVGNGVAGMEAALEIRRARVDARITVVSEESDHFFSRTALMYVLAGQLGYQQMEPLERDVYTRLDLRRVRARALGVDRERRVLQLAGDPSELPFDYLVLACGSRPRPPSWPGSDLRGIGSFVTLQDLDWLYHQLHGEPGPRQCPPRPRAHLIATAENSPYRFREVNPRSHSQRPIVIGGGLIGIEVVETMVAAGLKPVFLIRDDAFWPIALNERESKFIARALTSHGVDVRLQSDVTRFEGENGSVRRVVTAKDEVFETDLVVVAIGVVPNTEWLETSSITLCEPFRGIEVDANLETGTPGIYAAGDCASVLRFDGARRPEQLWYTARDQGRIVGRRIVGENVSYARGTWYNSAKLMDVEYTSVGFVNANLRDESEFFFEETGRVRSTTRVVRQRNAVVGFNFLGRRWDNGVLRSWIEERRPLSWVLEHLGEANFDTEFVPPLRIPRTLIEEIHETPQQATT